MGGGIASKRCAIRPGQTIFMSTRRAQIVPVTVPVSPCLDQTRTNVIQHTKMQIALYYLALRACSPLLALRYFSIAI
jgi:hypothetical protein